MRALEPPVRDHYHHGDLRHVLLETALRLIAERGPEGFSLREAARAVGVSPAAAYRHFADKPALIAALAADGHGLLAAAMEDAAARVPPGTPTAAWAVAAFVAIGHAYVEFAVASPSHFRVMFGPSLRVPGFVPCCAPSGRDGYEILGATLDDLVAAGAIPPERREGGEIAAWSAVHGFATLVVDGALHDHARGGAPLSPRGRADAYHLLARNLLLGMGCDPALAPEGSRRAGARLRGHGARAR